MLPNILEGKGGCSSGVAFGRPREIIAGDGFLVPFAVEGLVIGSGLLPTVPLLFLLLELATDRARECLNEDGLAGRDWLYGSACSLTYPFSDCEIGPFGSGTGVVLRGAVIGKGGKAQSRLLYSGEGGPCVIGAIGFRCGA